MKSAEAYAEFWVHTFQCALGWDGIFISRVCCRKWSESLIRHHQTNSAVWWIPIIIAIYQGCRMYRCENFHSVLFVKFVGVEVEVDWRIYVSAAAEKSQGTNHLLESGSRYRRSVWRTFDRIGLPTLDHACFIERSQRQA